MANVFFTGCTHLGHLKILTLGHGRPFSSLKEHDETLIKNWNARVTTSDVVFHLGDFNYKSSVDADFYLKQLNGKKFLIIGNHDHQKTITADGWEDTFLYQEIELNNEKITLCHYPIAEWNGYFRGAWMLHSHVHGNVTKQVPIVKNRVDVGVDNFNFAPATFEEIKNYNKMKIGE
jgi:calcineurin-like phosphoesterase family protein